jgi:flagellar basal-body rod protein FlgB
VPSLLSTTTPGPTEDISLFALADQKLAWLQARQSVLAQNIANTDTPGYRPRDLAPFDTWLRHAGIAPARTDAAHLVGYSTGDSALLQPVSERAPDGNAVGLEDQMTKIADNESAQALVGNLWKTYMNMFMTALGHSS